MVKISLKWIRNIGSTVTYQGMPLKPRGLINQLQTWLAKKSLGVTKDNFRVRFKVDLDLKKVCMKPF